MRGTNDDEICKFVELTRHAPINVRFIEWMPFDGNVWSNSKMVPYKEMHAAVCGQYPDLYRCQVSLFNLGRILLLLSCWVLDTYVRRAVCRKIGRAGLH